MLGLLARHPGASKTEAIERAIADHLRADAIRELCEMGGTVEIEDVSREMRTIDRTGEWPT